MFYYIVRFLAGVYVRIIFRIKVTGEIPKSGALLVCANHTSLFDPVVMACCGCVSRRLSFVAKKELFNIFLLGPALRAVGAFPVDRDKSGIGAIKASVKVLGNGGAVLMFPEGTRNKTAERMAAKSGIVMIAQKARACVVPVGINAAYKLFSTVRVNIGEPIDYEEYYGVKLTSEQMNVMAEDIMTKIFELAEE